MVKVHTPAVIVCAGRLVNPQVVVTPPDVRLDRAGGRCARRPSDRSSMAAHAGGAGAVQVERVAGRLADRCSRRAPHEAADRDDHGDGHDPADAAACAAPRCQRPGGDGGRRGGPQPRLARGRGASGRSMRSRRRWCTSSVMRPVFGVRNHGPSSLLISPLRAAQPWNGTSANESTSAPEHALQVAARRLLEDQAAEVHQGQGEDVREEQRPAEHRRPAGHVSRGRRPRRSASSREPEHEQRRLQVVGRVERELELLERADEGRHA